MIVNSVLANAAGMLVVCLSSGVDPLSGVADPVQAPDNGAGSLAIRQQVCDRFQLHDFNIQRLQPALREDGSLNVVIALGGKASELHLVPWSMRGPEFQASISDASGRVALIHPPAPATYRGKIVGMESSIVAASMNEGGLNATIRIDESEVWIVQPVSRDFPGLGGPAHVIYRQEDIRPDKLHLCGTPAEWAQPWPDPAAGIAAAPVYQDAQIAFDADFEFFQLNGSSAANTITDIENVMNSVEAIYKAKTGITYTITQIVVRTSADDPYSSTDPGSMLCEFRNHWNASQGGIVRDVAHMMTGRDINGSVVGIAYSGVVCNNTVFSACEVNGIASYGLSQSRFSNNLAQRAALTAHELGHNWNAQHCDGEGGCGIMCSSLGGCSGSLTTFGTTPTNAIIAWRNAATCLTPVTSCPADVNGSNAVNIDDLLAVINGWGPCANPNNCPADVAPVGPPQGNDVVNIDDLLTVINGWGPCQ